MARRNNIIDDYYYWLTDLVVRDKRSNPRKYDDLLSFLHEVEFIFTIPLDDNRAFDGMDLRYRYARDRGPLHEVDYVMDILDGPCSVLEMMVALSLRCEENIMDDTHYGNRTGQWFWKMITSLGLGAMDDTRFNQAECAYIIERFLNREYEPNGRGGLFTIYGCDRDLRDVEIWRQMCWYLDSIV